ncbi:MAG TPA: HAMP domain-containing sensor histidine kinase [Candidatus Paceibacterota bacterium]|nr:HAMP domain-containing sensor histidine kinase [Verrucomicrobiota bacterium]HRZ46045.1 HAMP domain-containing sensor histidine kinase [Candidatus Paceibacterota bacterium]
MKTPIPMPGWLDWRSGTTLIALGLAALVPALCVLWFMTIALRNERLAVQQRLTEVHQNHLETVQRQITAHWRDRRTAIESSASGSPAEQFQAIVRANLADSAIVYDPTGKVLYPAPQVWASESTASEPAEWAAARQLEFQSAHYPEAAEAYGQIARTSPHLTLKAKALQSQAGCLIKAGQPDPAVAILSQLIQDPRSASVATDHGALIVPNAQLLLLKLLRDPNHTLFQDTAGALAERLANYRDPALSSSQRRFLMEEMVEVAPAVAHFPTLAAERLAADYLEHNPSWPLEPGLQPVGRIGLWRMASSNRTVAALFHDDRLRAETKAVSSTLADAAVMLLAPGETAAVTRFVPPIEAGEMLPGCRLALTFSGPNPIEAASAREIRLHLWGGVLGVLFIALAALAAGRYIAAQMRLARIKNDLVSTVSHELKTPLASMRVLVDTLLAERYRDPQQLRAYLNLLTHENQRLSRLIENFLSFTRLEQHRQRFQFGPVKIESLVENSVAALVDRYPPAKDSLRVEIDPDLPAAWGDAEALTTVLVNLLDNAWKYTETAKQIVVRVGRKDRWIVLAVADNGIGLTQQQVKRIFDRFYQADQSLSRRVGGCGLGLSIVQSIVKSHGGSIAVDSDLGKGSTFRVKIPVAEPAAPADKNAAR